MKNNKLIKILFILLSMTFLTISSCKPEENEPDNESEVITTLHITFRDSATGLISGVFTFADPDGDGGNNPTRNDSILLASNRTYFANLTFLDQTKTPVDSITNEIIDEGDEHQIFYNSTNSNINVIYNDTDANGDPIGVSTIWYTSNASTGSINFSLKHQPDNSKNGNPLTGETDFENTFNFRIN